MVGTVTKIVDCLNGGKMIASYLTYAILVVPSDPPDLIKEAKESFILQGIVKPPFYFTGIKFRIRDGR
jgi:hypothetical protein